MATTYEAIATVTVGSGGAANIEFTSIPATYTDLVVKLSLRTNFTGGVGDDLLLTINGSTSSFSNRYIYGNGSNKFSGTAYGNLVGTPVTTSATSNTFSNIEIYFPNYAGSTNKSYSVDSVSENNATEAYAFLIAGLRSNTDAITSLKFSTSYTIQQYSTATLYGIKNS
jgi:hypothetical protein